jgi:hypothetical protein
MQVTISAPRARRSPSVATRALATVGLLAVLGGLATSQALAALRPSPDGEHFSSRRIRLESDSKGNAMFEAPSMSPGETVSSTTKISCAGDTESAIHLYGATTGTRFAEGLRLLVSRDGVHLYTGTLADFPDDYDHAVVDPITLSGGGSATYRFSVTLMNDAPAGNASQDFTWEARSV